MTRALVIGVGLGVLFGPVESGAELQRVEAVGIYGIRDSMRSRVIPRDEAIAKARWEGVSRVALELIGESAPSEAVDFTADEPDDARERTEPGSRGAGRADGAAAADADGPSKDELAALRRALGNDVLPYTRSYRILDDRGEVPVLFNDEPDVAVEYVVVVEVIVDVDRLSSALAEAGLIAAQDPATAREAVVVELIGLSRYEAFDTLLEALRTQLGATRIRTLEFAQGRQLLAVEGPFGPDALLTRLGRFEDPQLVIEPIGVDPSSRRIRVMGRWFADSDAETAPPG